MIRAAPDWRALQSAIAGDVVLPGSPDYESARKPVIARFHDVQPQAVVLCESPADGSETISLASRFGLRTATRSGQVRRVATVARQALASQYVRLLAMPKILPPTFLIRFQLVVFLNLLVGF